MLIWGGDHDIGDENEDYSMVTNLSCPHCGVYVEVYLPKDEEYLLGVNQGGTGLTSVGSAGQVLKSDGTVLYWDTTSAGSSSVIDIGPLTSSSTVYSKVVFGSLTV